MSKYSKSGGYGTIDLDGHEVWTERVRQTDRERQIEREREHARAEERKRERKRE